MFDRRTLYSLNKLNPDAIVYMDAEKNAVRLTREDFDTDEEFQEWKSWSDVDFHDEELGDHRYADHKIPNGCLLDCDDTDQSPDAIVEREEDRQEQAEYAAEVVRQIRHILTDKQFNRLWMHYVDGMTIEAIAEAEGRTHQGISKSINTAKEKIKKFFSQQGVKQVAKAPS